MVDPPVRDSKSRIVRTIDHTNAILFSFAACSCPPFLFLCVICCVVVVTVAVARVGAPNRNARYMQVNTVLEHTHKREKRALEAVQCAKSAPGAEHCGLPPGIFCCCVSLFGVIALSYGFAMIVHR